MTGGAPASCHPGLAANPLATDPLAANPLAADPLAVDPIAPGEAASRLDLATLPSAPFWARRQTRATLRSWRIWPETIDTAELLASELVTNAVKFAGPGPQQRRSGELDGVRRISLVLRYLAGQLIIEVTDPDPRPPVAAKAREDAESGRGLLLIEALSQEWDYYPLPSGGKCVYCVLAAEPWAAEPWAAEPRAAEPRAAEPRAAAP